MLPIIKRVLLNYYENSHTGNFAPFLFLYYTTKTKLSFNTTTVRPREQHPRSHHKGATDVNAIGGKGRVRTGDRRHPVLCICQPGPGLKQELLSVTASSPGRERQLYHDMMVGHPSIPFKAVLVRGSKDRNRKDPPADDGPPGPCQP